MQCMDCCREYKAIQGGVSEGQPHEFVQSASSLNDEVPHAGLVFATLLQDPEPLFQDPEPKMCDENVVIAPKGRLMVTVTRLNGTFGMRVSTLADKLLINSIIDQSAVSKYNASASQPLEVGDQIIVADGVTGNGPELFQVFQKSDKLTFEVLKSRTIDVEITKGSDRLGLVVEFVKSLGGALIKEVQETGAIAKWNVANPDKIVISGMLVIACNGKTEHLIVRELNLAKAVKMVLILDENVSNTSKQ